MKNFFTLLLAIAAGAGTMFAWDYENVQIGDLYYNLDNTNYEAQVARNPSFVSGDIMIPAVVSNYYGTYKVTSIGDAAFDGCTGLTSVTIGNYVTSIGEYAFRDCSGLTSIEISNFVTSIGFCAFSGCSSLIYMNMPNSLTSIGTYAFRNCSSLTSIEIPNTVTSIGNMAFSGCTGLTSVVVESGNRVYDSRKNCNAIIETATNTLIYGFKKTVIPNSVKSIGDCAFAGCTDLTSIRIPNSVTSIGVMAFADCSNLKSVTIPNSVTSIEAIAFSGCSSMKSINIPNSVTSIGNSAFQDCSSLTSIDIPDGVTSIYWTTFAGCSSLISATIPNSVTSIEDYAFANCTALKSIYNYRKTPVKIGSTVFQNLDYSACTLYVPEGSIDMYKSDNSSWKDFFNNIEPISATPTTTGEDIKLTPTYYAVKIVWPQVTGAETYEIVIRNISGNIVCTLIFNAQGQLTSTSFNAPGRNMVQLTQVAGFEYSVTGLDSGTEYDLTITSKDANGEILQTDTISFTTSGEAQGIDEHPSNPIQSSKLLRNGQVLILRGDKKYSVTGQEVH